jgi:hypothetical protein
MPDLVGADSADGLLDLEFDESGDIAPSRVEAKAPQKPLAPTPGLQEPATLVEALDVVPTIKREAPAARPAPAAQKPAAQRPAAQKPAAAPARGAAEVSPDDEPEIEVSYGTDEALALQAELGYGEEEGEFPDSDTQVTAEDQLTLADMPYTPRPAPRPAPLEFDDLPAPAPVEAELDDLLEPPTPLGDEPMTPAPATPVPHVETPRPAELEARAPMPRTEPSIRDAAVADKARLRAKTVEDFGPLLELSEKDEARPAVAGRGARAPVVAPADERPTARPRPVAAPSEPKKAAAAKVVAESLADVELPEELTQPRAVMPAPAQAARPAEPVVHGFAPAPIADRQAHVGAFSGDVPAPRPKTLGELIRLALAVGRK